ncbi:hypothetical protein ACIGHF_14005 [Stenotrophomonas sp. NPDC077464]|uniref:hypothetical protein n=1 Tax=unclassified Stenotrophomonas TaxID=196198 RepID=UPI0037D019FE
MKALWRKAFGRRVGPDCRNRQINIVAGHMLAHTMRYLSAPCLLKTAAGMETGAPILIHNTREAC